MDEQLAEAEIFFRFFCLRGLLACSRAIISTAAAAVMTDDLVAAFRFDCLRGKSHPADAAADILEEITRCALADDMTKTEVADMVLRRSQPHRVEQIRITSYFK